MTRITDEFRPETLVAIDAVERALELARHRVGAADITAKDGRDLVTATDVAVEDAVRGIVRDALSFLVVGEERGGAAPADGLTAAAIRADRWHVRSLGTTLALSYLAAGRISAYILFCASAIHTGPGTLLATEAGGTLKRAGSGPGCPTR